MPGPGQELDSLFVSLSVKGLRESMDIIQAFRSRVKEAQTELGGLGPDLVRGAIGLTVFGRAAEYAARRVDMVAVAVARLLALLAQATRLQTAPLALTADPLMARRANRPQLPTAPLALTPDANRTPIGRPIPPPNINPWMQLAATIGINRNQINALTGAMAKFGTVARLALAGATASVVGFVRAGLSGTVEGNYLSLQWQMLSREIASVFLPLIRTLTSLVQQLVVKFQQLDGEGQKNVRNMALMAGGAGVLLGILPKLASGFGSIGTSAAQIAMAFGATAVSAGPIGIAVAALAAVAVVVAGAFALAYSRSAELRASVQKLIGVVQELYERMKPIFTQLFDAFARGMTVIIERVLVPLFKWAANQFMLSWNNAISAVQIALLGLSSLLAAVSDALATLLDSVRKNMLLIAAVMPALAVAALAADKAGADAALRKANDAVAIAQQLAKDLDALKVDPNRKLPKKPNDGPDRVRQAGGGAESAESTFRRLQDAVYRISAGEDDPAKQALQVARDQLIALQLIQQAVQAKAPPAVQGN
jgi:hypothetical protein